MASTLESKSAETVRLTFEMDREKHRELKIQCARRNITMADFFRQKADQELASERSAFLQGNRPEPGVRSRFRPITIQGEPLSETISRDRGVR